MRADMERPVDVMVTHDSPIERLAELDASLVDIADSAANRQRLRTVVEACKPRLLYHAHYHLDRTYRLARPDHGSTLCRSLQTDGVTVGSSTVLDTELLRDRL
jgi:hypothetical protein